ncbi:hypothetical protein [Crocosphaera chwakensis]|uniref:hypothetical protein n=1 Tax=Crocosphaera chwakensis TaxID=2546361 RepID=UPI00031E3495|nr:hypothetical protein [Crocosphaera chwakensis]
MHKSEIQGTVFPISHSFTDEQIFLIQKKIEDAIGDETTILSSHLKMPESWKKSNK